MKTLSFNKQETNGLFSVQRRHLKNYLISTMAQILKAAAFYTLTRTLMHIKGLKRMESLTSNKQEKYVHYFLY